MFIIVDVVQILIAQVKIIESVSMGDGSLRAQTSKSTMGVGCSMSVQANHAAKMVFEYHNNMDV